MTVVLKVLTLAASLSSAADSNPQFVPTGKWSLSSERGQCELQRDFKSVDGAITVSIRALPFQPNVEVALVTNRVHETSWYPVKGALGTERFDRDSLMQWVPLLDGRRVGRVRVSRTILNQATGDPLLILESNGFVGNIHLSGFQAAREAIQSCEATLIGAAANSLGFTEQELRGIRQHPLEPVVLRAYPKGYSEASPERNAEDLAIAAFTVDEKGNPTTCALLYSGGDPALSKRACLNQWVPLKFKPARDHQGHAVRGIYFHRERWYAP